MPSKWPAFSAPKQLGMPGNDDSHNFTDPNKGGGPAAPVVRNAKKVPNAHRGGPYQSGVKQYVSTSIHGGRGGSGNPASRGGSVQHETADTRNPGHGGSVQTRDNMDTVSGRGGFGNTGHQGVPTAATNPKPGAGNMAGRMAKRITGRFNNKSKGATGTGRVGSYGDRAPITANT